jgi:lipoprotein-releasing system permease protein
LALGVIIALITISTGIGAKNAIKERLSDFTGHISVHTQRSNNSYNSSVLQQKSINYKALHDHPGVASTQVFASASGILRTKQDFTGVVMKGVSKDFDQKRFQKFITQGKIPTFGQDGYNNEVMLSEKIAGDLKLKLNDSVVAIFTKDNTQPIYRKFKISALYRTEIKYLDDIYIIGDLKHVKKILGLQPQEVGGMDIFLKDINDVDDMHKTIDTYIGLDNFSEKPTDKYPQIGIWLSIFDNNIAIIVLLMLVVVVTNIMMVLMILIIERIHTIGLLKSFGAQNSQIRSIFINYTLLIMLPGIVIGNVIGLGLLLIQKYFGLLQLNEQEYYLKVVPVDLNPWYILLVSLTCIVISGAVLILPSYLISKISPVKAIRYD